MGVRRAFVTAVATAAVVATSAGCSRSRTPAPDPSLTSPAAAPATAASALPAGALVELVPTVAELPEGFTLVDGGSGPLDAAAVSERSVDPAATAGDLERDGFLDGYVAEYVNDATGAIVTVVVLRYSADSGAIADMARAAQAGADAERHPITPVGDESFAVLDQVAEGDVQELVALRMRVGEIVWLVETGGAGDATSGLAEDLAARLARRIN